MLETLLDIDKNISKKLLLLLKKTKIIDTIISK